MPGLSREERFSFQGILIDGRYRVDGVIGEGSISTVFRALCEQTGQMVAIKVLNKALRSDADYRQRFEREIAVMQGLDHPHIARAMGAGRTEGGLSYVVMELLTGERLRHLVAQHAPLPWQRAVVLLEQLCEGLAAAHQAGVAHRDVKPENIYVTQRDGRDWVTITDFGLAYHHGDARLTSGGMVVGSLPYMAPELFDPNNYNAQTLDGWKLADVFSMGCVAHELLVGYPPHVRLGPLKLMLDRMAGVPPQWPDEARDNAPGHVLTTIEMALRVDPKQRPSSIAAFAGALAAA